MAKERDEFGEVAVEKRMTVGKYREPITISLYAAISDWASRNGLTVRSEESDEWVINRDGDDLLGIKISDPASQAIHTPGSEAGRCDP